MMVEHEFDCIYYRKLKITSTILLDLPGDLCESPVAGLELVFPPLEVVEVVEVGLEPATTASSVPGSSAITSG
jgi:hypothetical protein